MRPTTQAWKRRTALRRRRHTRRRLRGTAARPRLAFHKSLRHLCAQVIDDTTGVTLLQVTTDTKANRASGKKTFRNIASAKELGAKLGTLAKEKSIATVVFDRGGHPYHGVVKTFADAVREQGVKL